MENLATHHAIVQMNGMTENAIPVEILAILAVTALRVEMLVIMMIQFATDAMKVATLHVIAVIADLATNAIRVVKLATLLANARLKFATFPRCAAFWYLFEEKI